MEPISETLTSPSSIPTLPFDLIDEILCRLPVKLLLQLQCVCKSWKSLISDPNFAKKHFRKSTPRHHLLVSLVNKRCDNVFLCDNPIPSVFSNLKIKKTQFNYPNSLKKKYGAPSGMCSCDGILCFVVGKGSFVLWNPSIQKFKILPPLNNTPDDPDPASFYGFGYDHLTNNYKVLNVSYQEASVYTLGTDFWRRIQPFPYSRSYSSDRSGEVVSGTVNWLITYNGYEPYDRGIFRVTECYQIVSLDLAKETYQKLSLPDLKRDRWNLGLLKDCLCICASSWSDRFLEVWTMNEFGNKESWTKLYTVSYMNEIGFYATAKPLYIYKDNKLLMDFDDADFRNKLRLGFYDSKNGTLNNLKNPNMERFRSPEVYAESLISPCF